MNSHSPSTNDNSAPSNDEKQIVWYASPWLFRTASIASVLMMFLSLLFFFVNIVGLVTIIQTTGNLVTFTYIFQIGLIILWMVSTAGFTLLSLYFANEGIRSRR